MISFTIEKGRRVSLPVFIAAGSVVDCVLKYPPNGQPNQHLSLNLQPGRSCSGRGTVKFAVLPIIIFRTPPKFCLIRAATSFSTQFISIGAMKLDRKSVV